MGILAIDTSTKTGSAALVSGDRLIGEHILNIALTHSERLMPAVARIMEDAHWQGKDIEGIAVTSGPGSFTGLRIGMTTAKTLAYIWGCPIVGVQTLDVLAFQGHPFPGLICPILDARRDEVYTCIYEGLTPLTKPWACPPEELTDKLVDRQVLFLGDGVDTYQDMIKERLGDRAVFAPPDRRLIRASSLGILGGQKLARGEIADVMSMVPIYLRRSEAEITWEKKCGGQP